MRVNRAEVFRYRMQFRPPAGEDTRSSGFNPAALPREGMLISLYDTGGTHAWGEVAPLEGRSKESLSEAEADVRLVLEQVVGKDLPRTWEDLCAMRLGQTHLASVAFGIELALSGLAALTARVPLSYWFSPSARDRVAVNALISGGVGEATETASRRMTEGYQVFKLKVAGHEPDTIARLVGSVRDVIGGEAELRLDANRCWEYPEAVEILRRLEQFDVAYIEEPLKNPIRLSQLIRDVQVPVALDETVMDRQMEGSLHTDAFLPRAVILKPTLVGGLCATMELAEASAKAGVEPVITSAFESEIGLYGLASLAAALPGSGWAAGLDTIRFFEEGVGSQAYGASGPVWNSRQRSGAPQPDGARIHRICRID